MQLNLSFPIFFSDNCEGSVSPFPSPSPRIISRSACEPQRDKEVFFFLLIAITGLNLSDKTRRSDKIFLKHTAEN